MTLPGKLTIGFLQEDNPQKFYFRVRPALVLDEAGYRLIEDAKQEYLEDGFIRIVPDKNELNHFKTRMRTLGRCCAIDLRKHTGENDKIRPNKNHNGENGDRNAFIVYSDVITAVEPLRMAEVVDVNEDGLFQRPGTRLVVLRHEGELKGVYLWNERDGEGAYIEGDNLAPEGALSEELLMSVPLPEGEEIQVMMDLDAIGVAMPEASAPVERNEGASVRTETPDARADMESGSRETVREESAQEERASNGEASAHGREKESKPWLQSASFTIPRAAAARSVGSKDQSLAQQSGFNPRRGLSIKDIIDDMWRQSRFDQLGHPVVGDTAAAPVISPVDRAMEAVQEAWSLPEARASLVSALLKLEKLDEALGASGSPNAAQARELNAGEQQMLKLEADRLKVLGEIDELKRFRQDKRDELLAELRRTHSAEFERSEQRNERLLSEQKKYQAEATAARKAAEAAQEAFNEQMLAQMDRKMTEQLLSSRAVELMAALSRDACASAQSPEIEDGTAGELISDIRVRFDEAGIELSNDEAVNLLACVTLGRILIVSGPCGSEKSLFARTLAAALGIAGENSGCFEEIQAQSAWRSLGQEIEALSPAGAPITKLPEVKRVLVNETALTPTVLMIDDANRGAMDEYLGEMLTLGDEGAPNRLRTGAGRLTLGGNLRLTLTVQDGGNALSGELLDRAWLIRRAPEACDTAWPPKEGVLPKPEKAVSMETLERLFKPVEDVSGEIAERMRVLREKLAANGMYLSRRALKDIYRYCSAVQPYMTCKPLEILDWAFAQRVMPSLLASANLDGLHELGKLLPDMPRSLSLMTASIPLPPL